MSRKSVDTQTRHALKQDHFVNVTTSGMEWVGEHRANVVKAAVAVVLLIGVIVAGILIYQRREAAANELLGQAMDIYETPLAQAGQPTMPGQKTYPTAADRAKAANPIFREVAEQYGWLDAGAMARYFAGITEVDLGQQSQAQEDLKKASESHDGNVAALAKLALANLDEQSNRGSEAVSLLQDLIKHPTSSVPKVAAQFQLASYYEATQPSEARRIYAEIKDQNKNSEAGQLATQKLQGGK